MFTQQRVCELHEFEEMVLTGGSSGHPFSGRGEKVSSSGLVTAHHVSIEGLGCVVFPYQGSGSIFLPNRAS